MPTALVARAFERAVASQRPAPGLLHHSDRGSQYASDAYRELLRRHGVVTEHEPGGQLLRQRQDGELLGDDENRTHRRDQVYATRSEAKKRASFVTSRSSITGRGSTAHSVFTRPWTSRHNLN